MDIAQRELTSYEARDSKARAIAILRDLVDLDNQGFMADTPANDVIARARDLLNTLHMPRAAVQTPNTYSSRVGIAGASIGGIAAYDPER